MAAVATRYRASMSAIKALLWLDRSGKADPPGEHEGTRYRLRSWPDELPASMRTLAVFRVLSAMSVRPVSRQWVQRASGLNGRQVESLFECLRQRDLLESETAARGD